jgi:hypothetical protein
VNDKPRASATDRRDPPRTLDDTEIKLAASAVPVPEPEEEETIELTEAPPHLADEGTTTA